MTAADRLRDARGVRQRYRTDRRTFDRLVREALVSLPDPIRRQIGNVAVVVEEWPADDADEPNSDDQSGGLVGLYHGVPLTERPGTDNMLLPDRITIYRQPILAQSRSEAEAREEIRLTVLHEVGHFFGLGDDELP